DAPPPRRTTEGAGGLQGSPPRRRPMLPLARRIPLQIFQPAAVEVLACGRTCELWTSVRSSVLGFGSVPSTATFTCSGALRSTAWNILTVTIEWHGCGAAAQHKELASSAVLQQYLASRGLAPSSVGRLSP